LITGLELPGRNYFLYILMMRLKMFSLPQKIVIGIKSHYYFGDKYYNILSFMHYEVLDEERIGILPLLKIFKDRFYLAGDTAF